MLLRAGVLYGLGVTVVLLFAAIVWQRAAITSLKSDALASETSAADLRVQLERARTETAEARRDARIAHQSIEVEALRRQTAERSATAARAELDAVGNSVKSANQIQSAADAEIARLKDELAKTASGLNAAAAAAAEARVQSDAARAEADSLRRQMPVAITGSVETPAAAETSAGAPPPASAESSAGNTAAAAGARADPAKQDLNSAPRQPKSADAFRRPNRRKMPGAVKSEGEAVNLLPF